MPYITSQRRDDYHTELISLQDKLPYPRDVNWAGLATYLISSLIETSRPPEHWTHHEISATLGALEGAKAEFLRRVVAPFEDKKREENGDI